MKNSITRNLQELDRVRKLYKRFFRVSWTFSITRFLTFFRKTDFFNISNEVGRVKRDLIFVSKLDRSVPFLRSGLPFFFLSFLVSDPRFRRKISR